LISEFKSTAKSIIILFVTLTLVLIVKNQFSYVLLYDSNYGMEALIKRGSVENLFMGSSTFRQGLDIDVLGKRFGESTYILSYNGNQPCTEYIQLEKLIKNQVNIDNLYMDMYAFTLCKEPGLDDEKLLMELTIPEKKQLYGLLPDKNLSVFWEMFVSSNNEQIATWIIYKHIIDRQFKNGGILLDTPGMSEDAYRSIQPIVSDGVINDIQLQSIKNIITLCKDNSINLVFVETPKADNIMNDDVYLTVMDRYEKFLTDNNVRVIRYLDGDLIYDDFADGLHLSAKGRERYSEGL